MARTSACESTPPFARLCPAMTVERFSTQRRREPDSVYHRETAASRVLLTQHPGRQPRLRSVSKRTLVAPAIADRLIGNAAMIGAIGLLIYGVAAAEEEISPAGIADRPSAGFLIQLQQSLALLDRNFDQLRFRLDVIVIGEGGIAADRWSRHPH